MYESTPSPAPARLPPAARGRRWWPLLVAAGVVCLAVGLAWYTTFHKEVSGAEQTVRASLLISRHEPNLLGDAAGKRLGEEADFDAYRCTHVSLVRSRLVLLAALRQPNVAALSIVQETTDPVAWLEKELRVGFPE